MLWLKFNGNLKFIGNILMVINIKMTCTKCVNTVWQLQNYRVGSLDEVDNHTGVLRVWFLVLEGLADAVATGPKSVQPQILHSLFDLLRAAAHVTGGYSYIPVPFSLWTYIPC